MRQEADDVDVARDLAMQTDLELNLLGAQSAYFEGMLFVDEFDGDDGFRLVLGYCLADPVGNRLSATHYLIRFHSEIHTMHMRQIRSSWIRVERAGCSEVELLATVQGVSGKYPVQTFVRP
jgi:hypothetical protein